MTNTNTDPKRMVWNDPTGTFVILLDHCVYLADYPTYWTSDANKALRFASHDDAAYISAGISNRKAIICGKPTFELAVDGSVLSRLSVDTICSLQ